MKTTLARFCLVALCAPQAMAIDYCLIGASEQVRGSFGGPREVFRTTQSLAGARAALVDRERDAIMVLDASGNAVDLGTTTGTVTDRGTLPGAADLTLADGVYYVLDASGVSSYEPADGTRTIIIDAALLPAGATEVAVRNLPDGSRAVWVTSSGEVRRIDAPLTGSAFVRWAGSFTDLRGVETASDATGQPLTLVLTGSELRVYLDAADEVSLHGTIAVSRGNRVASALVGGTCQGTWCVDGVVTTFEGALFTLDLSRMALTPAASGLATDAYPVIVWGMPSERIAVAATDESGDPHTARVQVLAPLNSQMSWDLTGHPGRRIDVGDAWGNDLGGSGDGKTEVVEAAYSRGPENTATDYLTIWQIDGSGGLVKAATGQPYATHKYGATVAAGNLVFTSGDATQGDEILTGPGPGSVNGPQVRAFEASSGVILPVTKINFYTYGTLRYGVNVAAHGGSPAPHMLTGPGPGEIFGPHVRGWSFASGQQIEPIQAQNFFAYSTLRWGVEVNQGDFERDEMDEIVTGAGPGVVFGAQVRGFDWDWGPIRTIPAINLFLTDGAGRTGYYGARAAFIDANESLASYQIAGSMGSDPAIAYPNARLLGLGQGPAEVRDVNQGWGCRSCALYIGSNQR